MSDKIVVMNDGLKQQEGSPEEVYNLPSNHFVADFLGHSNFFNGVVSGQEGDMVSLELTDGHTFRVQHPGEWKQGDPIEMVVRAQSFKVASGDTPPPETGMNTLKGVIKGPQLYGW